MLPQPIRLLDKEIDDGRSSIADGICRDTTQQGPTASTVSHELFSALASGPPPHFIDDRVDNAMTRADFDAVTACRFTAATKGRRHQYFMTA